VGDRPSTSSAETLGVSRIGRYLRVHLAPPEASGDELPDRQQTTSAVFVAGGGRAVRFIECGDDGGVSLAGQLGADDVERKP
jgi:hypothetical protein